jgi:hypothetical protein
MPSEADATDVVVRAPRSVPRVIWRLSLVAMLVVVGVLLALVGGVLGWAVVALGALAVVFEVLQAGSCVVVRPDAVEVRGPLRNRSVARAEIVEIDPSFRGTERLRRPPALVLSGGKRVPLNPFEEPWRRVSPAAQELAVILGVPSDSWNRVEERGPKLPGRRR